MDYIIYCAYAHFTHARAKEILIKIGRILAFLFFLWYNIIDVIKKGDNFHAKITKGRPFVYLKKH